MIRFDVRDSCWDITGSSRVHVTQSPRALVKEAGVGGVRCVVCWEVTVVQMILFEDAGFTNSTCGDVSISWIKRPLSVAQETGVQGEEGLDQLVLRLWNGQENRIISAVIFKLNLTGSVSQTLSAFNTYCVIYVYW